MQHLDLRIRLFSGISSLVQLLLLGNKYPWKTLSYSLQMKHWKRQFCYLKVQEHKILGLVFLWNQFLPEPRLNPKTVLCFVQFFQKYAYLDFYASVRINFFFPLAHWTEIISSHQLSARKLFFFSTPIFSSFISRISCEHTSNAFLRSKKTPMQYLFSLNDLLMKFIAWIKLCSVDLCFWKPYWCLYKILFKSRWFTSFILTIFSNILDSELSSAIGR